MCRRQHISDNNATSIDLFNSSYTHLNLEQALHSSLQDTYEKFPLKNGLTYMVRLIHTLKQSVKAHCDLVREDLVGHTDAIDFLAEYGRRWGGFSSSAERVEELYAPFTTLVNEMYSALKPDDTKTPLFSIARLMIVTWRRAVY
jgi:hypothetical protein